MKDLNIVFNNSQFAVTVCDLECKIIYMNEKAQRVFQKYGDLIGKNLRDCHSEPSIGKIDELLQTGSENTYTIEKNGIKKIIHQTPWFNDGKIAGLVELSIEIPLEMPHFVRS